MDVTRAALLAESLEGCLLRADPTTRVEAALCILPWLLLPCHARSILLVSAVRLRICVPTLRRVTRWMDDLGVDTPARLGGQHKRDSGCAIQPADG